MAQEREIPYRDTEESKRFWEESERRDKEDRKAYLEQAEKVGESLNATLVGIWKPRPGRSGNPAVYQRNTDDSYFRILGAKDEVASMEDPEEVRKGKKLIKGRPEIVHEYAVITFDLGKRIKEGILFYTPEGYIEDKRYNPESDPPLVRIHADTPSVAI